MNDIDVTRSLILLTAGKAVRDESVTDSERVIYNELIRTGQAKVPLYLQCSKHPEKRILLYGQENDSTGTFERQGGGFRCVECADDGSSATAREIGPL